MKKCFLTTFLLTVHFLGLIAKPTPLNVEGTVFDDNLIPIPFATIQSKKSNTHVMSDESGKFSIQTVQGDTITVASLGYNSRYLPVDSNSMNVQLYSAAYNLEEIVVSTALGLKRSPRELGSATTTVQEGRLNQGSPVNLLTGLSSRVAGLRVNMYDSKVDPKIQLTLRGARSITGNNSPLYVVDGIPIPEINRLNPNDIESITVLKGANAAALYGSEGVNGALIISTKKGTHKRGTVIFRNSTSFSEVFLLPKAQTEFGQGLNGVYSPTEYRSWGPAFDGSMKDFGTPLPNGIQPQILYSAPSKDIRLTLFDIGINLQNEVSFSKQTDNANYFMSLQNVMVHGVIPNDRLSRTGLRFNTDQNFGKLRLSSNLNYSYTSSNTAPDGPWYSAYRSPANYPLNEMKNWHDPNSLGNPDNFFSTNIKNPYFLKDTQRNQYFQQLINGKVEIEYSMTSWLKVMYRLGFYTTNVDTRNTITRYDSEIAGVSQQGSVADQASNYRRINGDLIISAKHIFGDFTVSGILGHNIRDDYTKNTSVSAKNLLFPNLFNQDSRSGNLGGGTSIIRERRLGVYGELTAGYKNYLFLTATGRSDFSSLLLKENRAFFYPGVSGSFVFSDLLPDIRDGYLFSYGKFYTSYNKTGNINLSPYALDLTYQQTGGFPYSNLVGFVPSSKNPNPNIQPEFVNSFEVGTQLSFFKRRLNTDMSFVYSNSKGQIFAATSSAATGYTTTMVNLGELENRIVEFSIDGDIISTSNARWNIAFNYTHINNVVKNLYGSGQSEEYNIFRQSYAIKGKPYPSLKVTDYKRDPEGRMIVDPNTGLPTAATEPNYKGTMVPPHQLGLQTIFSYKNITLYMDFDCRLGGWMYSELINSMIQAGTHPMTTAHGRNEFVIPNSVFESTDSQGNVTYIPNTEVVARGSGGADYWNKYVAGYAVNYAAPSNYLKMKTLSVRYSLPQKIIQRLKFIQDIVLGIEATNLFVIRHKDNDLGDPEYLYNNTAGYSSFRQLPPYRTFGFTLNVVL